MIPAFGVPGNLEYDNRVFLPPVAYLPRLGTGIQMI